MTGRELVHFLREMGASAEWRRLAVTRLPAGWRFQLSIRNIATGEVVDMTSYQPFAVILAYVQAERYGSLNVRYHNYQGGEANR